jgi:hypothetical protein
LSKRIGAADFYGHYAVSRHGDFAADFMPPIGRLPPRFAFTWGGKAAPKPVFVLAGAGMGRDLAGIRKHDIILAGGSLGGKL